MFPGKIPSGLQQNSSSSTATDDTSTESKPAPTTERLPSQSTSTVKPNIPSIEESKLSIEESERSIEESERSIAESQRRIQVAQEQQKQYATFTELSRNLNESVDKFVQRLPEGNPIFLLRIIRGTTARLYETELQLPQCSVQLEQTPNLETLNLEVFNRIFGIILSNLGQLLELKPEIVGQIGGVDIFYEPARYPEFLSQASEVKVSGVSSTNSTTTSTPSNPSNSSASSLPGNSVVTPVPGETPIPMNEVDGLRFVLQSLPGEIKVKLGGEENYLPLENYYSQLVDIARKLQELKPKQLEKIAPLNLKGLSKDEDIAQAIKTYDVVVMNAVLMEDDREENPRTNSTQLIKTICGPDITRELLVVLEKVQAAFYSWEPERKAKACRSLYTPGIRGEAWDINELHRQDWFHAYQPECSTYAEPEILNCARSVKVAGQCYYAGSVNYVVFGKMCKLCQNEALFRLRLGLNSLKLPEGLFLYNPISVWLAIWYYKGEVPFKTQEASANYGLSQKWAAAGYSGWPSGGSTPESDRPTCLPICSIPYLHLPFTVNWDPESI